MITNQKFPATILIDHREKRPYSFTEILIDGTVSDDFLQIETRPAFLTSGDYSLDGFADKIAVERKSLNDLYSTLGKSRARFIRELERLNRYDFGAVVIEADWSTIISQPPARSRLVPKTIYRSIIAWQQRYPRVHWWVVPDRRWAEITTFRILERYWKDQTKRNQQATVAIKDPKRKKVKPCKP